MNSGEGNIQQKEKNNETTQKSEEENKYKIFYSPYGYLKILEKDINNNSLTSYNFINYGKNNLKGSIYKNNIKDNINIRLKSFTGTRKIIPLQNLSIYSKINILIENIPQEKDDIKKYTKKTQHRLYSSFSGLRELNPNNTFIESNLKDNEIILFFPEIPLSFSPTMKGKAIELSQGNKTAFKISTDDPQYALGNIGYNSGRHYFEIFLLTDPMIRSVVVGFCNKKDDKNFFSVDIHKFYGFILSDMKKTVVNFGEGGENMVDYGEVCNINDKIGVLFDSKDDGVYISFYKNDKNLGVAYEKLPNNVKYFPTVEMGLCGSKIQLCNDIEFPDL